MHRVCLQAGSSARLPPLHRPVQSAGGRRVFVQQRCGVPAAASRSGRHARRGAPVLVHRQ